MSKEFTTIRVENSVRNELIKRAKWGQSLSDVIAKLIDGSGPKTEEGIGVEH